MIIRLRTFLADQGAILDAIRNEHADGAGQKRLIGRGREIAEELGTLAPDRIRAMLMALLSRVDIRPDRVEIKVRRRQLIEQLHAQSIASSTAAGKPDSASHDTLTLTVKARLQRVGREMRMLVENADDQTSADPGLLRIVARAHDFQERLMQDMNLTVPAIANQERLSTGYLSRLLRLPSLAPDIIAAFVNGNEKADATGASDLRRLDRTAKAARISRVNGASVAPIPARFFPTAAAKRLILKCRPRDFRVGNGPGSAQKRLCVFRSGWRAENRANSAVNRPP